ncbi:ATP-binding cassette domain-containing protein [Rickettsiales bacterium]|nr:ATP-binding cassette domain-containing protein [Rickettsiales bacterium]
MSSMKIKNYDHILRETMCFGSDSKGNDDAWLGKKVRESPIATCLAAFVGMLDEDINPRLLYESLPYANDRDLDRADMLGFMANLGYKCNYMKGNAGSIDERLLPCVFINSDQIYILMNFQGEKKENITVYNCNKRSSETIKCKDIKKGDILLFQEDKELSQGYNNLFADGIIKTILKKFKIQIISIFVASLFISLFSLSMPVFVMVVYDKVIGIGQQQNLYYLLYGIAIIFMADLALRTMRSSSICWLSSRIDNMVSNCIYRKILYLKSSFTESASISSQVAKIRSFESIRNFLNSPLFLTIIELPFVIVMLNAIGIIAGKLALIPAAATIICMAVIYTFQSKLNDNVDSAAKAVASKQESCIEIFSKVHAFRYCGLSSQRIDDLKEKSAASSLATFESNHVVAVLDTIIATISNFTILATLVAGTTLVWSGDITTGALVATMIIIWRIMAPLQTMSAVIPKIEQVKDSVEQIDRLMKIESESDIANNTKDLRNIKGDVSFVNVGIKYSKSIFPTISGLTLDVSAGQLIAISGSNGSGKTTLLKLINGLYTPQVGSIRIDDMDIRQINPLTLRQSVDYLPQSPNFFDGSIADNLRLANPLSTDEEIYNILKTVDAYEDIKKLDYGIYTKIGGNNTPISTCLAYQLNMARALLKDSKIVLLDELPFALINSKSGVAYLEFIKRFKGKKTIFYVTHRDDHLKMADKVIMLEKERQPTII